MYTKEAKFREYLQKILTEEGQDALQETLADYYEMLQELSDNGINSISVRFEIDSAVNYLKMLPIWTEYAKKPEQEKTPDLEEILAPHNTEISDTDVITVKKAAKKKTKKKGVNR